MENNISQGISEEEDSDYFIYEEEKDFKESNQKAPIQKDKDSSSKSKGSFEDETSEKEKPRLLKKRTKKLKKFSESKTAFDGRKVVFTTDFTQTDWDWKDDAEASGKGKILMSRYEVDTPASSSLSGFKSNTGKTDSRQTSSKTRSDRGSALEERTVTDLTPFSLQPNDEFGIPITDISSDSDSQISDLETPKKSKVSRRYPPLVGPPLILKYVKESDIIDTEANKMTSDKGEDLQLDNNIIDEGLINLVTDEYGNAVGMLSGQCEFCGSSIKAFPSLEQQLSEPPESLYCCEDYREFVEFAMTTANRLEEDITKRNKKISVKVHRHYGSKEARMLAKEKAVHRMHEREVQRRRQEASGLHSAFQYSFLPHEEDMDIPASSQLVEAESKKPFKKDAAGSKGAGGASDRGAGAGHKSLRGGGSVDLESIGGHSAQHIYATHHHHPTAAAGSLGGYGAMRPEVTRQMKTINYQLSSQRCLEEGWTLRAPSPLAQDDPENDIYIPEPLHPAMIATGKIQGRELIQKFYPNGSPFLTVFPDGTGNIFYPSGRLAILITSVSLGQNSYIVMDDAVEPQMLAMFDANGFGTCYYANGKIRLNYDQVGGIELDVSGARRKSWSWKDHENHIHAPPFQPIVFGMNYFLGVRFMTQESIALSLTGKKRSCRFNVGVKLKLVSLENVPNKFNEYQLFIDERRLRIENIMSKVSNLLKFPKSPKLESMLPPLSLTSKQHKVEKKKQELLSRDKKLIKQNKLPPLHQPAVSVSVN